MATHAAQHRNHTVDQSVSQDPRQAQPTESTVRTSSSGSGDYPLFVALLTQAGFPAPVAEYRFAPPRRWRADYAYPIERILIEIEGAVWQAGRHTRGGGYIGDCDKYNEAALLGFRVLRFTPDMLMDGRALDTIRRALCHTLRSERQRSTTPHDTDFDTVRNAYAGASSQHSQDLAPSTAASASTASPVTAPTSSATVAPPEPLAESRTSVWTSAWPAPAPSPAPATRHHRS